MIDQLSRLVIYLSENDRIEVMTADIYSVSQKKIPPMVF